MQKTCKKCNLTSLIVAFLKCFLRKDHFTVVDLVPQPLSECEAEVNLNCFDTNLLCFVVETVLKNTSQHKNNLSYIIKQESLYQNKVNSLVACILNGREREFQAQEKCEGCTPILLHPQPPFPSFSNACHTGYKVTSSLTSIYNFKMPISKEHNLMVVWFHFHFLHPLCLELYHSGNLALQPVVSLHIPPAKFWLFLAVTDCESTMFIKTECVVHAMLASLHINTK